MNRRFQIHEFSLELLSKVKEFADLEIGKNYYTLEELQNNYKKSIAKNGEMCSFVLLDQDQKVHGLRLAYPPGNWVHGKGNNLRPELWPFKSDQAAYFQSLFISEAARGSGYGPKLSDKSIQVFKKVGAKGIVTHCWKESPNNSSFRYLTNTGFKSAIEHPNYWIDIQYTCSRDGYPCRCTAIEMYKEL